MAKPRYRTANDRLIEKANSPAIVDVMLPPMMLPYPLNVGSRLKMKNTAAMASSGGIGNGRSASLPNAQAAAGSVTRPRIVTILNAMLYGTGMTSTSPMSPTTTN